MKIIELRKVPKNKIGKLNKNGVKLEPGEEKTCEYLILFGFNIDIIRPTSTKHTKNADALIAGTIWEIKTPTSSNKNTIKIRFREASSQAEKIVFDLRFVKGDVDRVERQLLNLLKTDGMVRRMMIIKKSGELFDFRK